MTDGIIQLAKLPFYWRLKQKGSPNIVPDHQPFEFDFIEALQLIIQKRNSETWGYLETIYKADYNIGYLQDANEIAKPYGKDFMDFIDRSLKTWGSEVRTILEVGCGGCTILSELQQKGYEVTGIDPSPVAQREGAKKNIRVIEDFFPTPKFPTPVDLIFHSDVQEHVPDPVAFLRNQKQQLNENGLLIISLPDCNEGNEVGELSMAMHQHLNYFDNESLRNTVEAAGLKVLAIETAKYGGSLYCCAQNTTDSGWIAKSGREKFDLFQSNLSRNTRKVCSVLKQSLNNPAIKTGFYVPLRTLPYISYLNEFSGFRFFDDTGHWYNRAFDGAEIYIENFSDLKSNPVDHLYIMSLTFGTVIRKKVAEQIPAIKRVVTLHELLQ